jgi:hypothetical protein
LRQEFLIKFAHLNQDLAPELASQFASLRSKAYAGSSIARDVRNLVAAPFVQGPKVLGTFSTRLTGGHKLAAAFP